MVLFCIASLVKVSAQDANVFGHVVCEGKHLPYVSIVVEGTTIGTLTDQTGHFQLINVPVGKLTVSANYLGYKSQQVTVTTEASKTTEIKFDLEEDALLVDEVVVSADRSVQKRTEAPVIVTTLSPKLFSTAQSISLGESLNFTPGLRLENNCQNCGFSQVRMNGMEGPYSQILINSRPIFSGLAGVYGLELLPTNMIERIEVVRGGGSALYGGNAIAGTINIITKEPTRNTYKAGADVAAVGLGVDGSGGATFDYTAHFNTSLVTDNRKTGLALYGFTRERGMFDANDDGFSEVSPLKNLTIGTKLTHRFADRNKITLDFFNIRETRDGGSDQWLPLHERRIGEVLEHDMKVGAVSFEQYFRENDLLTVYGSGQILERDSYYGAEQALNAYGTSFGKTYNVGAQYKANLGNSGLLVGLENSSDDLLDRKLGYPEYSVSGDSILVNHVGNTVVANQFMTTTGAFAQYDLTLATTKISVGARYDAYSIADNSHDEKEKTTGSAFSPRINVMQQIVEGLKFRASYSQGYRAPQIFDEDLHIETSGLHQVIHKNADDLKQETSHSTMASLDYNGTIGKTYIGFLAEGFYTRLNNAFSNEIGEADSTGTVTFTRVNAEKGATVMGLNFEFKLKPIKTFMLTAGYTVQSSKYQEVQDWGTKTFLRTPNNYGFLALDWDFAKSFCLSATANYIGSMTALYEGEEEKGQDENGLVDTKNFFDLGLKLSYKIMMKGSSNIEVLAGVKNIFNSYQDDFDSGINRDPAYIYGPNSPRTLFFGVSIGNF